MTLMGQPSSDVGTPIHDQLALEMWPDWSEPEARSNSEDTPPGTDNHE